MNTSTRSLFLESIAEAKQLKGHLKTCSDITIEQRDRIAELESLNKELVEDVESRERRRMQILEWLQDKIGTAFDCECGAYTYHSTGYECQECGHPMPLDHYIAFKLHASHYSDWQAPDESTKATPSAPASPETDPPNKHAS